MQTEALADIEVVIPYTSHYQRTHEGKKGFLGQMYAFNILSLFWKRFQYSPHTSLADPKEMLQNTALGTFLRKLSALHERYFVCNSCLKSKQTCREYPPVEQRQRCSEIWERASVDGSQVRI